MFTPRYLYHPLWIPLLTLIQEGAVDRGIRLIGVIAWWLLYLLGLATAMAVSAASTDRVERQVCTRVLILVVTPGERDAVLDAAYQRTSQRAARNQEGERTLWLLGTVSGSNLMLVQASDQGTATAGGMQATARAAIEQCQPDHVILTGTCFGLRPGRGQQIGDVIVARQIYNIEPRKVAGTTVIRRGVRVGSSPFLLDRFQAGQQTWDGQGRQVHTGLVLTSNTLVNSAEMVSQLQREFPDAIADEMEAAGVYEAATNGSKPDWIMIKGISDWGEGKTGSEQPHAAKNAAEFVLHVLATSNLRRQQPSH